MEKEQEIRQNIADHLMWDDRLHDAEINVDFNGGVVELSGFVTSQYSKTAAENDVLQIEGVKEVKNHLSVKHNDADMPPDEVIKDNVKDLFYWNDRVDYSKIDMLVKNHVVTLLGTVDAFWKISLAEDLAYSVKGVMNVVNKLSAVPTRKVEDELLGRKISEALERNLSGASGGIFITVKDGVVVLEGRTDNLKEKSDIFKAVQFVKGIKTIQNNILIYPEVEQEKRLR